MGLRPKHTDSMSFNKKCSLVAMSSSMRQSMESKRSLWVATLSWDVFSLTDLVKTITRKLHTKRTKRRLLVFLCNDQQGKEDRLTICTQSYHCWRIWRYMIADKSLASSNNTEWINAIKKEIKSLHANEVWDLVELPKDRRTIGSKCMYKTKRNMNGTVKDTRLVVQGYSQQYGQDYDETFSPVIRFESARTVLVFAVNNLKLHQMNVTRVFLNVGTWRGGIHEKTWEDML